MDGKKIEESILLDWKELLRALKAYFNAPYLGTPEYTSLTEELREWKTMNPSTKGSSQSASTASSKTNKEKFKELTDYMKAHSNSSVDKAEVVRLDRNDCIYKEHWKLTTGQEFTIILSVVFNSSSWRLKLYLDTSLLKEIQGADWEDLLEELEKCFHVPKAGTQEYKNLCESTSMADDFKLYENLWD
jgi:hypothetical protein